MTDEEIMKKAIELAKISGDEGEVPVGAVVTKNGEIVATEPNEPALLSLAPKTTRFIREFIIAPAHIGHGSRVT